jgi:hypothetical protein
MACGENRECTLHAYLYEIECGLFCVTYRSGASGSRLHALPIYQLGNSEADARQRLEQAAKALGYETIIWERADAALPDFASGRDRILSFQAPPRGIAVRCHEGAIAKT